MKRISILGSTGSIGTQTLDVVRNSGEIEVVGLAVDSNIELLYEQIQEFRPQKVTVMDADKAKELKSNLCNCDTEVLQGMDGLIELSSMDKVDTVVTSLVGMIGIRPTIAAIKAGKNVALANKETLVTAGELVMNLAEEYGVSILPVDSEHSAIYQCLQGNKMNSLEKIILTASGGPFRGRSKKELEDVTLEQALKHPNWSMGKKITIDSATLMNKGLEVIEAKWLFDVKVDDIQVVVHPQSIIHSMVQYVDGSIIAQLGRPDMRLPIQYALDYPDRTHNDYPRLDFNDLTQLTFEKPDLESFRCLQLAYEALKIGGTMTTVLNAANEEVVSLFLREKIRFLDIPYIIEDIMAKHKVIDKPNIDDILKTQIWVNEIIERGGYN